MFPVEAAQASKNIKPEGTDFVNSALAAGGIAAPDMSVASMAGSAAKWCVPGDAQGGRLEIVPLATLDGKSVKMKTASINVASMLHPTPSFKNAEEASQWMQRYHFAPQPTLLVPAAQILLPQKDGLPFTQAFLEAAFRQDPTTAARLGTTLATSDKVSRMFTLDLLAKAGILLESPPPLSEEEKKLLAQAPALPDPFDMRPDGELFSKLDRLWGTFSATGRIEPIKALTSALAWRADYDAFVQMKKEGKKPTELTESLARGLAYMAAGWSLDSFKGNDVLVADYLEAIAVAPDTPASIKKELAGLDSEPAFHRKDK
jgi:hypothetical protein